MPTVSIIIPTYNNQATLPTAVESVLNQTYSDLEIIVVDDGSTDTTQETLQPYQDHIRYVFQQNRERSNARNHGIRLAQGELIAFLDADDWWLPEKIKRQVELFQTDPLLGMVYCEANVVDKNGRHLALTGTIGAANDRQEFYCKLLTSNLIPSPTPLIRRETLLSAGGFDECLRQGEDWDCWLRLAQITSVGFSPEPLACYRVSSGETLLHRMAQRGGAEASVQIIQNAIQRGGCSEETLNTALALAHFQGSLVEAGCDQVEKARQRLEAVHRQFPGFFVQNQEMLIDQAANLAAQVCLGESDTSAGVSLLGKIWSALPAGIYPLFVRKKILSRLQAIRFFQAGQVGNRHQVVDSLLPMILNDPAWMRNRGVWSLFFHSLSGLSLSVD